MFAPRARAESPPSLAGWLDVESSGRAGSRRRLVLEFLLRHPETEWIPEDLHEALRAADPGTWGATKENALTARLSELRDLGFLAMVGSRRGTAGLQTVWALVPEARSMSPTRTPSTSTGAPDAS